MPRNRFILLMGMAMLAVLLGVHLLFIRPQQKRKALRLQREISRLEALYKEEAARLVRTRKALEEILEEAVLPARALSGEGRVAVLQGLDRCLSRSRLNLLKMEPLAPESRPHMRVYPLELTFQGDFPQVLEFVEEVEKEMGLVAEQWALEVREGVLQVECRLLAWEWRGDALSLPSPPRREVPLRVSKSIGRDPFRRVVSPPPEPKIEPVVRVAPPPLRLTGILEIRGKRRAIIDGKVYGVGDTVRKRRILKIGADSVHLEGGELLRIQRELEVVTQDERNGNRIPGAERGGP